MPPETLEKVLDVMTSTKVKTILDHDIHAVLMDTNKKL
jgi:hypothetical protein